jgi:imidazolonepropionase-like amidohydrolase
MQRYLPLAAALLLCVDSVAAQGLFLTNARIVDPETGEVRSGSLLIVDGVIAGSPEGAPAGFAGQTIDLEGRWVIPGLNDLHTHSYGNGAPGGAGESVGTPVTSRRMLYAGVTGFLDLFAPEDLIFGLRDRQRQFGFAGADIFASGPCLTATDGHCSEYGVPTRIVDSPEDARREVTELAQKRPDVVKIVYQPSGRMPSIDKETFAAAVSTASENGIKTVIHIGTWDEVRDAVEVGASAVTHMPAEPVPPDLAALMAERGVYSIPTLAVETEIAVWVADPELLASPLATALTNDAIINAYRQDSLSDGVRGHIDRVATNREAVLRNVKALSDAGVPLLAGTDAGNWGTIQGYSVHRELAIMVEAGLTPWQALAASTTTAGEFLGRSYGVSQGDEANLVVLDASPIEEIQNTQNIYMVVYHGEVVDRDKLLQSSAGGR